MPVNVYTWGRTSSRPFNNMIQTITLDPRAGSPDRLANRIAARVQAENPPKVVLRYWKELAAADRDPFDHSDPIELWRRKGFRDGLEPYWRDVARRLKQRGITPDYIVQDLEEGIRYWEIPEEDRESFFTTLYAGQSQVRHNLPPAVFAVDVNTYLDLRNPAGDAARHAYEQAAVDLRTDIIRETMHRPFVEVYGRTIPHTNYNDILPSFAVTRRNNNTWFPTSVHGISAPVSYLTDHGPDDAKYRRYEKHPRWNHMINVLNALRSAAANGPVHPWVAAPGYGRRGSDTWARAHELQEEKWLWEIFMTQCLAMGIDTLIMWNPGPPWNQNAAELDDYMDDWFSGKRAHHELLVLPEIPMDADVIETNGVTVRYQDFINKLGNR